MITQRKQPFANIRTKLSVNCMGYQNIPVTLFGKLIIFIEMFLAACLTLLPVQAMSDERPGEGRYLSALVTASSLKNDGHFTTGAPIQTVESVRYSEDVTSYGIRGALGYGRYGWLAQDVYLGVEAVGAYIPFDKNPKSSNPNFSLSFERNIRLGVKVLVGIPVRNRSLLFSHIGYYYSDHSYGANHSVEGGWEDHDITGPGIGLGYRYALSTQLDFIVEYTYITYNMDQSLKDGAASKQRIRDNDVGIGLTYKF